MPPSVITLHGARDDRTTLEAEAIPEARSRETDTSPTLKQPPKLVGVMHDELSYSDREQETLPAIATPFSTRLPPISQELTATAVQQETVDFVARVVGFEPTTNRLTADCSTAELHPTSARGVSSRLSLDGQPAAA
jgi:hypothetical protein